MTLQWKPYKDKESVFWSEFKKDGDIGLVTKFKNGGDGYKPDLAVKAQLDGYEYWAKAPVGQKGVFYVIERKKINSPGDDSPEHGKANWEEIERKRKERDEGFEKRHRESMEIMKETNTNIKNLNETMIALLEQLRGQELEKGKK